MSKSARLKRPLTRSNINSMPHDKSGVYGFWCRNRCIYIGKTESKDQSIRNRVMSHWIKSHNKALRDWINLHSEFLDICYIPVKRSRIEKVDKLETKLIRMLNPETNNKKKRR